MAVFERTDAMKLDDKKVVLHDKTGDHLLCAVVMPKQGILRIFHMGSKDVVMDVCIGNLSDYDPASQKPPKPQPTTVADDAPETEVDKMKREILTFQIKTVRAMNEVETRQLHKELTEARSELAKAKDLVKRVDAQGDSAISDAEFKEIGKDDADE